MSMDHPEGLGSASASEVPARPPGSGYNFRPRSRSATAPKNRRLGSVELQGVHGVHTRPASHYSANFPHTQWSGKSHSGKHTHSWKRRNKHPNNFPRLDDRVESAIFPADARHSRGRDESSPFHTDSRHPQGRGRISIFHTISSDYDNL